MAYGLGNDIIGVMSYPTGGPMSGYEDWAGMSGMQPAHPLVGGSAGSPGYGGGQRSVALAAPDPTQAVQSGAPVAAHWSQLFNLKGNPIGWVALASIFYLGISSIHLSAGANVGGRLGR
jgi:hypothetical protein